MPYKCGILPNNNSIIDQISNFSRNVGLWCRLCSGTFVCLLLHITQFPYNFKSLVRKP